MQFFKTTEKATSLDYPYGRKIRCTMYFSLEYKAGKGFRTVRQSINPKTGRLNAAKLSTYYPVIVMYQDEQTGYYEYKYFGLNGSKEINRTAEFIAANFDLFTPDQIKGICGDIYSYLKAELISFCTYCGADKDAVYTILQPAIKAAIQGFKEAANVFKDINVDQVALEATKVEGFNPFTVTTGPVKLSEL